MKRTAQVLSVLNDAASMGLWLSYREIGLCLGMKAKYAGAVVERLRQQGATIDCRGSSPHFEYIWRD